jgi:tRNA U34 5-methylaminomethyl-2-thiouridine-forming methyltransferase MnmC
MPGKISSGQWIIFTGNTCPGKKVEQNLFFMKIITTDDGSHTVYNPTINDHFHSIHGAVSESVHVYINAGFRYHPSKEVSVLEVGFGTGLNVLLTLKQAWIEKRMVNYDSIDNFVLPDEITDSLNYYSLTENINSDWFSLIHNLHWNMNHDITDYFRLRKILADIHEINFSRKYDIVYFDAFGPDRQPDMWTEEVFIKIYNSMNSGGILTTFSSKGEVRRRLQNCGFVVEKLPGAKGKREMIRCLVPA